MHVSLFVFLLPKFPGRTNSDKTVHFFAVSVLSPCREKITDALQTDAHCNI